MKKMSTIAMIFLIAFSSTIFIRKMKAETGLITGRAVDYLTHIGVRFANIELDDEDWNVVVSTTTDENGYYSVSSIPSGYYYVYAWNGSWGAEYRIKVLGGETLSLTLELVPNPPDDWHWTLWCDLYEGVQAVLPGETASFLLSLTAESGYAANFSFSADALPPSSSYTFDPPWLFYYGDTTMFMSVSPNTPAGTYHILVLATSESLDGIMGIGVTLIVPGLVQPDFEISVLPQPEVVVHVGGWNDSISLSLRSINDYSGSIQLNFQSTLSSLVVNFSPNPVDLPRNEQISVKMNITVARGELSSYFVEISATDGSITRKLILTIILVGNMAAIKNLVQIQEANVENLPRRFTIQQNFFIAAPNGTVLYWGQNVVEIHQTPRNQYWLNSRFQVWIQRTQEPIFYLPDIPRVVSFPIVLNLTSYIEGNELVMENNASRRIGRATLELPTDSYITVRRILDFSLAPQICLVGYGVMGRRPLETRLLVAYFGWPTSGKVDSWVKLVGEYMWRSTRNAVFDIDQSSTGEQSQNLIWWLDGAFLWADGATDQGLLFTPNYETPL